MSPHPRDVTKTPSKAFTYSNKSCEGFQVIIDCFKSLIILKKLHELHGRNLL